MNKFISGSTYGDEFEQTIFTMLDTDGIPYRKEQTLSNSKRRVKDKSCDLEILLSKSIFIELKTVYNQPLTYNITLDTKKRHLKFHQIAKMDYLIVEYRPNKPVVISKRNFLVFVSEHKKNSMTYSEALEIGFELNNFKWIKEVRSEEKN